MVDRNPRDTVTSFNVQDRHPQQIWNIWPKISVVPILKSRFNEFNKSRFIPISLSGGSSRSSHIHKERERTHTYTHNRAFVASTILCHLI